MELFKGAWIKKSRCTEKKNCRLPDYHFDNRNVPEKVTSMVLSFLVVCVLAYFFYRNILAIVPLSIIGIIFYRNLSQKSISKQNDLLEVQFKECILSVAGLLKAGYAVENAFRESERDMEMLFGEESMIVTELGIIRRGLVMNIPLETLLQDFSERSISNHINQFAQVFSIAKRSGGNMTEVIRTSADLIARDIESRKEIHTVISGRRAEQNIMKLMPFAIILYVGMTSKGYFDSLYGNATGMLVMSGCLAVYLFAYIFGDKVLEKIERES